MQQQIWGEVVDFNLAFFQFISECNSEKIIKIGPYLPKLLQEKFGAVFLAHPVYAVPVATNSALGAFKSDAFICTTFADLDRFLAHTLSK